MSTIARWHPVTSHFALFDCPIEALVKAYIKWHRSIDFTYDWIPVTSTLSDAFGLLPPLAASLERKLFVQMQNGWTAFFQSGINGSDPWGPTCYLAHQQQLNAMTVCSSPTGAVYPAVMWSVLTREAFDADGPLATARTIAACNDGGRWTFDSSGKPFEFEDTNAYSARRLRDRFTHEMLCRYLSQFKLRPFDDDFYVVSTSRPAIVLNQNNRLCYNIPKYSLEQVLDGKPWRSD